MLDAKNNGISQTRATIEVLITVFFWSASFALMKIATETMQTLTAVWFRIFFGMIPITCAVIYRRQLRLPPRGLILTFIVLGSLGVTFHQNLQLVGMITAGVANANWLIAGTPSFVAILGWLFLKERISKPAILGLLLSGCGVLLVVGLGTRGVNMFRITAAGDMMIALSALNWAVFVILSRKFVRDHPPAFTVFWINMVALIEQTVLVILFGQPLAGVVDIIPIGWFAIFILGFFCSGLAYVFWYDGLAVMPAAKVTAFQFLQPILGAVIAYIISGERFTPFMAAGGALILTGVWLVNRRQKAAS